MKYKLELKNTADAQSFIFENGSPELWQEVKADDLPWGTKVMCHPQVGALLLQDIEVSDEDGPAFLFDDLESLRAEFSDTEIDEWNLAFSEYFQTHTIGNFQKKNNELLEVVGFTLSDFELDNFLSLLDERIEKTRLNGSLYAAENLIAITFVCGEYLKARSKFDWQWGVEVHPDLSGEYDEILLPILENNEGTLIKAGWYFSGQLMDPDYENKGSVCRKFLELNSKLI